MSERIPVVVLGVTIGTASGWDQSGDFGAVFYDFQPRTGLTCLRSGDINIDEEHGFHYYNDSDELSEKISPFVVFKQLEKLEGEDNAT